MSDVFSLFSKTSADTAWCLYINVESATKAFLVNREGVSRLRYGFIIDFPAYLESCRAMMVNPPEVDFLGWCMKTALDEEKYDDEGLQDFIGWLITDKLHGQEVKNEAYHTYPITHPMNFARAVLWVMNQTLVFEVDKLLVDIDCPVFLTGSLNAIYPMFYNILKDEQIEVYTL